jgi:predicted nucleic acid-binding protein
VRTWIANPPSWLEVHAPKAPDFTIALDVGERDAVCLALELSATLLLLDDKAARRVAKERGLRVAGTLGILELASSRGLVNLPSAVAALERTSYRIRTDVVREILEKHSLGGG